MNFIETIQSFIKSIPLNIYLWLGAAIVIIVVYIWKRRKARSNLYFEPWANLSNDKQLEIGLSPSQIMFHEMVAIHSVYRKGATMEGLWNEQSSVPAFLPDKNEIINPDQVDMLGISGKFGQFLKVMVWLISLEKPLSLKGNVHRFGDKVRIQVFLDGGRKPGLTQKVCWLIEHDVNKIENLPASIKYLAHNIYMELGYDFECKTVENFESFTNGLNKHIEYMEKGELSFLEEAISYYEQTNKAPDGNNPYASYQIARLLYYQYTPQDNEKCIEKFKCVLNTSNTTLRAHAYRGLANAYCQKNQRHKIKEPYLLLEAIRFAEMAYDATAKKNEKDEQIVKALAYTYQVLAENESDVARREKNLNEAKKKYKEAISLNNNFTIAYNNLGYIHLKEAERS